MLSGFYPFGTNNFGAKSCEEYQKLLADEHLRKTRRYKEIENEQIKAKEKTKKDATEKIFKERIKKPSKL